MKIRIAIFVAAYLFVLFLTLKLCGYLAWSWWWVASPLWVALAAYLVAFAAIYVSYRVIGDGD